MKKILVYAAALLSMAFAASCQQEVSPELGKGEAVNVTFTISNEAIQSKAVVGEEPEWEKELTFGVYRNGKGHHVAYQRNGRERGILYLLFRYD